jgi:hypothetical protein
VIPHWPKTAALTCGCEVALMREGEDNVVMYFPCNPKCPTLDMTKQECKKAGKPWEKRNVRNN